MNQHQRKFAVETIERMASKAISKIDQAREKALDTLTFKVEVRKLVDKAIKSLSKKQLIDLFEAGRFAAAHDVSKDWRGHSKHTFTLAYGDTLAWSNMGYNEHFSDVILQSKNTSLVLIAHAIKADFTILTENRDQKLKGINARWQTMTNTVNAHAEQAATHVMLHDGPEAINAIESFASALKTLRIN